MPNYDVLRERMVENQIARRGVRDPAVLGALRRVPRELFVPEGERDFACDDLPLPIGEGQTISQPYIVALMAEAAQLHPGDRVLDIGAGSGYAAAVMNAIGARVFAIERLPGLATAAAERLRRLGYSGVELRQGDGSLGWPEAAPFDAILAAAGGPEIPDALKRQLRIGGRLVMPVGPSEYSQRLVKLTRSGEDIFAEQDLGAVSFVPLIGAHGWRGDH